MKLKLIDTQNIYPGTLQAGNFYECKKHYFGGEWLDVVGYDYPVSSKNFETPLNILERFINNGNKVILAKPTTGVTVEILVTDRHLIVYSHTKGNHWNISGNHYKYGNDIETGEYIPAFSSDEKPVIKQRLLMADFKRLCKIIETNNNNKLPATDKS